MPLLGRPPLLSPPLLPLLVDPLQLDPVVVVHALDEGCHLDVGAVATVAIIIVASVLALVVVLASVSLVEPGLEALGGRGGRLADATADPPAKVEQLLHDETGSQEELEDRRSIS